MNERRRKEDATAFPWIARKIDLGHILIIASMLAAFALGYGKFEQRLVYVESNQAKLVDAVNALRELAMQGKYFREEYGPRVQDLERRTFRLQEDSATRQARP